MKNLLFLLLLPSIGFANDKLGTMAILAVDWAQTRHISTQCHNPKKYSYDVKINGETYTTNVTEQHFEKNPILGTCPSLRNVNLYFLSALAISYSVPNKYHKYLHPVLGMVIIHNKRVGIRLRL